VCLRALTPLKKGAKSDEYSGNRHRRDDKQERCDERLGKEQEKKQGKDKRYQRSWDCAKPQDE
jgi:hypothetical protein